MSASKYNPRHTQNGRCKVCSLPGDVRARLERLHVGGASDVALAREFAEYGINRFTIMRHVKNENHLSRQRKAELLAGPVRIHDLANKAALESKSLLEYLQISRSVLFNQFLNAAEASDRYSVATLAPQLLASLKELGKLSGELRSLAGISVTTNNFLISADPQYPQLESGLLRIIERHPEARVDVMALLAELEANSTPGSNGAGYPMIEGDALEVAADVGD